MGNRHLVVFAAAVAFSTPAVAGITVLGSTSARICYLAADGVDLPAFDDIHHCNAAINEAINDRPILVATHVNRGIVRMRRNDLGGALQDFDAAIRLNPSEPEAYFNRGALFLRRQNPSEAAAMFSRALEHNTRRPALAHYGRAIANEAIGNVRGAYEDYQRASALNPEWAAPREELQRFRVIPASQTGAG